MSNDIFSHISKIKLQIILNAFHHCTELPIRIFDEEGHVIVSSTDSDSICDHLQSSETLKTLCKQSRIDMIGKVLSTKESQVFTCPLNLNYIIVPYLYHNKCYGSIYIGPFLFKSPEQVFLYHLANSYNISALEILDLNNALNQVKVISDTLIPYVKDLTFHLFQISKEQTSMAMHLPGTKPKALQISSETVENNSVYPYEKEKLLINKIKSGNTLEANAVLNELLGYVLFSNKIDLDSVKARVIELCSILSRVTIEYGATPIGVLNFNNEFIKSLQNITDIYDLANNLKETVEVFISSIERHQSNDSNDSIQRAADYIAVNYAKDLTLEELADYVHLNASYFSNLFSQTIGYTFKSYLNIVRIEKSKDLLTSTDYSFIAIANAVGFEDHNYFSKVFKKHIGMTPSQYRNNANSSNTYNLQDKSKN